MDRKVKLNILNLEPHGYSIAAKDILNSIGIVDTGPLSRDELLKKIKNYDVLIVRLGHFINEEIIEAASRLKVIITATTGLNHIDLNAAAKRGITVLSLKGENVFLQEIHATAEHTWALILALLRKIPGAHTSVLNNLWDRDSYKGQELCGKTLGIVGLGRIGRKVAHYGSAFGMKVIACEKKELPNIPPGVLVDSIENTLALSDIISIHVDYTEANHDLFGRDEIAKIKKGAYLINTSRGEVLNETALLEALINGHLAGAALDVLCGENRNTKTSANLINYAKTNNNLIITPHIGGCTEESMEKTEIFMAKKLRNYLLTIRGNA